MKQIISIDSGSKKGQRLIALLQEFRNSKYVEFLTETEIETHEDAVMLKMIGEGIESGLADTETVLKKLGIA